MYFIFIVYLLLLVLPSIFEDFDDLLQLCVLLLLFCFLISSVISLLLGFHSFFFIWVTTKVWFFYCIWIIFVAIWSKLFCLINHVSVVWQINIRSPYRHDFIFTTYGLFLFIFVIYWLRLVSTFTFSLLIQVSDLPVVKLLQICFILSFISSFSVSKLLQLVSFAFHICFLPFPFLL